MRINILLIMLLPLVVISQNRLSGVITDSTSIPIDYAEVILINGDSSLVFSEITNETGGFEFINVKNGEYTIVIRQFSENLFNKKFKLYKDLSLDTIRINRTLELKEFKISEVATLLERDEDRLVFNVRNSLSASGGDLIDLLKITPIVSVQNGQISMIGKDGVILMLNGKYIDLSGDDLLNFLKNFKSQEILKIEVITNPPVNSGVEGNFGIVNVVTKQIKKKGVNGNIRGTLSQSNKSIGLGGVNLNYQNNRFMFFSNISYDNGILEPSQNYRLRYPNYLWIEQNNKDYFVNKLSGRFTANYIVSSRAQIGVGYNISNNKPLIKSENNSSIYGVNEQIDSSILSFSRLRVKKLLNSINLYSIVDLDSNGKRINIDLDYLNYMSLIKNSFYSNTMLSGLINPNSYYSANNSSDLTINIASAQIDFTYPTKWASLNIGSKFTVINNSSSVSLYNTTSGIPEIDLTHTNEFKYNENTLAIYASGSKQLTKRMFFKAGLRGEKTQTEGNSVTLSQITNNNYFQLFPSVILNYSLKGNKAISLNYNRRINRPLFNDLNPFRFYSTSFNYSEGNPYLKPYYSNNIQLSLINNRLYTMLYTTINNNRFDQVTFVDTNTTSQKVIPTNFYNQITFGVYQGYSFNIKGRWESNSNVSFFYTKSNTQNSNVIPNISRWSGRIITNNTLVLDKKNRFRAEVDFTYQLPSIAGSYELSEFYQVNVGIRANLMKKRLLISLQGIDILKSNKQYFTQTVNKINQENFDYSDLQRVRLTLMYSFGNNILNKKTTQISDEEQKRIK